MHPPNSTNRFQILSIDGGGIRGVFAAAILAAIEEDSDIRIVDHFDLISGTSTGGIIAIALGMGVRPVEIVQFYATYGPEIFSSRLRWRSGLHWLARKYSANGLRSALRSIFGDRKFGESSVRLVIPSFDMTSNDVYLFRTPHLDHLRRDYKLEAWRVAMATAAAPTYFRAFRGVGSVQLVDGGVWANNPSLVAITEAIGPLGCRLDDIALLSIGTLGPLPTQRRYLAAAGKLMWAASAPALVVNATAIGVAKQTRWLLSEDRYLRIDAIAPEAETSMDDVSNVECLMARAHTESRHAVPSVSAKFLGHQARPYRPSHPVG